MSAYGKSVIYLIGFTAIGFGCLAVFQPSQAEINKIKNYDPRYRDFSTVVETAAKSSDPIYRQNSAQIQSKVNEALKKTQS